ncbi:MAG: FHA domain-containing protein [Vicinamibacterales bacterium]
MMASRAARRRRVVIDNGRQERELLLSARIVIGRDPSCEINDPDPLLSRRHAEIVAGPQGAHIRDLSSRNGILVNGEKTRERTLQPGDVVQVGNLQLRYFEEEAAPADVRGTSAPAPPSRTPTPIPRGRAAFEQAARPEPVRRMPAAETDVTMIGTAPLPLVGRADVRPAAHEDTHAETEAGAPADATIASSDGTLQAAIAHLANVAHDRRAFAAGGARLVADPALTVLDATPECADLLGVPGEPLVGDSLTDVFLRGVRRAYADADAAVTFTITRDDLGAIAVTLSLNPTSGHD